MTDGRTPKRRAAYEADLKRRKACGRFVDGLRASASASARNQSPRQDSHIATNGGLSAVIRPMGD